ncbi:caspase family protein [Leptospira sp. 96542]|nr:caspase family protein [Leptospira sp. 96542]
MFLRSFGFCLVLVIFPSTMFSQSVGKRYGFVVGVNEYNDLSLSNLKTAKNDAMGITKILYGYGSYNRISSIVQEGSKENRPTKQNIESKYESILEEMNPEDFLIFYFSGHGVVDYNEKVYLLAEDADPKRPFETGISLESLIYKSREYKLKRVIFLVDACRNPEDGKGGEGKQYLDKVSFSDSEIVSVFFSTKLGYSSFEDFDSGYGIFTKYLLYGLEGRADSNFNGEVSYSELTNYVIQSLRLWSKNNSKLQKPYTKEYAEKSEDIILTYAVNPETSITDAPLFNPYNPTFAFRSMVFPGWGQYVRGQETKGKWYMAIYAASLLYSGYQYLEYKQASEAYKNAVGIPPNNRPFETIVLNYALIEPYRRDLESSKKSFSQSLNLLAFVWAINVFDFYLYGPTTKSKTTGFYLEYKIEPYSGMAVERIGKIGYEFQF